MNSGLCDNKSGLLAHYDFNQGSGTTLTDQSGNGYHGTFHGDTQWNMPASNFIFSIINQPTNRSSDISLGAVNYVSNTYTADATYTHDGSETTSDSFTYKGNDGTSDSNTETASISITAVNDAPVTAAVSGSGAEGGTITTTLTATDVDDIDGFTDFIRSIKGVEVAFMISEIKEGKYRINFRSRGKYVINDIAEHFNGGGHKLAAGATVENSSFLEIENTILTKLNDKKDALCQ